MARYNAKRFRSTGRRNGSWRALFAAPEHSAKPKCYVLEMFPYPSGRIHMGHVRNYTMGDCIIARFHRAQGFAVLHPMGWDAFGLHGGECGRRDGGVNPRDWTYANIDAMRAELKALGAWRSTGAASSPPAIRPITPSSRSCSWPSTRQSLVYRSEADVNWDPVDMTVLANEQVIDGTRLALRRGGGAAQAAANGSSASRPIREELLTALEHAGTLAGKSAADAEELDRPQRRGCASSSRLSDSEKLDVFHHKARHVVRRAHVVALSPDHPLTQELAAKNPKLQDFIAECRKTGTAEAEIEKAEKLGFDTGLTAAHPFDPAWKLPVLVANFVLMGYGTGAIFGCPAHDQRDLDFARKYGLNVTPVVVPDDADAKTFSVGNEAYVGPGKLANSRFLDGMTVEAAKDEVAKRLEAAGIGQRTVNYRLRDGLASRQRAWGCPFPMIHCAKCGVVPVTEADLPVKLPDDLDFKVHGNPLDAHPTFTKVKCPGCCGGDARRRDRHASTPSWIPPGISRASPTPSRRSRSIAKRSITGCRSISISAASSMRSCICSIRASSPAPCTRQALSKPGRSPSPDCSPVPGHGAA